MGAAHGGFAPGQEAAALYSLMEELRLVLRRRASRRNPRDLPFRSIPWDGIVFPPASAGTGSSAAPLPCPRRLLDEFGETLMRIHGQAALVAEAELAVAAFLDFLDAFQLLPWEISASQQAVRRFLGNAYLRITPEPDLAFLQVALRAIPAYYRFLSSRRLVSQELVLAVQKECADTDWYRERLELFYRLEGAALRRWAQKMDYLRMPPPLPAAASRRAAFPSEPGRLTQGSL